MITTKLNTYTLDIIQEVKVHVSDINVTSTLYHILTRSHRQEYFTIYLYGSVHGDVFARKTLRIKNHILSMNFC